MTLLFGLSGVRDKEIKSSTVLEQQSTAAALSLCLQEVQSYWFLPFFSLLTAETAKLLISWQANKSTKLIWFNSNFWKMKVPETSVCFILVSVSICKVSFSDDHQLQCCRVVFLKILWPFNLVLQVICMEWLRVNMSYLEAPSKSPPIPIDLAPITLFMWSKWSVKPRWKKWCIRNTNYRFTSWQKQKRTQHGCLTSNIRDVRLLSAGNEIAVEIHHDHPSVLFLKHNKQKNTRRNVLKSSKNKKKKIYIFINSDTSTLYSSHLHSISRVQPFACSKLTACGVMRNMEKYIHSL